MFDSNHPDIPLYQNVQKFTPKIIYMHHYCIASGIISGKLYNNHSTDLFITDSNSRVKIPL